MLFICCLNWTEQGAKAVKGVAARHENLKAEIARLGGRLLGGYVTRGQYDVVLVLEMPDGDAMTKLTVGLISRGNVRTTTLRAHSIEDFGNLAAEVPRPHRSVGKVWIKPIHRVDASCRSVSRVGCHNRFAS